MKPNGERGRRVAVWLGVVCLVVGVDGGFQQQASPSAQASTQPAKAVAAAEPQSPALHIPRNQMTHDAPVYSVAYSSDGKMLASGSGDQTIKLWDVRTGKER